MPDSIRASESRANRNPTAFSRLLQEAAEGHALWHPGSDGSSSGSIGDCGYFEGGRFIKLFNVSEPPSGLPSVPLPDSDIRTEAIPNTGPLQSSRRGVISLGGGAPFLPFTQAVTGAFELSCEDSETAFLAFGGETRAVDSFIPTRRLARYLVEHQRRIMELFGKDYPIREDDIVILHGTTKARAWLGGIAYSDAVSIRGSFSLQFVGLSVSLQYTTDTRQSRHSVSTPILIADPVDGVLLSVAEAVQADPPMPGEPFGTNINWNFTYGPAQWNVTDSPDICVVARPIRVRRRERLTHSVRSSIRSVSGAFGRRSSGSSASSYFSSPRSDSSAPTSPSSARYSASSSQFSMSSGSRRNSAESNGAYSYMTASTDDEPREPDLLEQLLDRVLRCISSIEYAVGDYSLVQAYKEKYPNQPLSAVVFSIDQLEISICETDATVGYVTGVPDPLSLGSAPDKKSISNTSRTLVLQRGHLPFAPRVVSQQNDMRNDVPAAVDAVADQHSTPIGSPFWDLLDAAHDAISEEDPGSEVCTLVDEVTDSAPLSQVKLYKKLLHSCALVAAPTSRARPAPNRITTVSALSRPQPVKTRPVRNVIPDMTQPVSIDEHVVKDDLQATDDTAHVVSQARHFQKRSLKATLSQSAFTLATAPGRRPSTLPLAAMPLTHARVTI